jgi:uncharacterized protein YceH (UPF0502 family)
MNLKLGPVEARIVGCLIEKAITTPDQYPLSLNALVNACNQKSNRDPLLSLSEKAVQETLDALARRHLVVEKSGFGSRVRKFQHRFCNTEYGTLRFSPQELALLCELLLRGPQTPGELRSRAARMAPLIDSTETERVLQALAARADGPFVTRLAREPGRRDARYAHCFHELPAGAAAASLEEPPPPLQATSDEATTTVAELERRLEELEERLARLEALGNR